MSSSKLHDLALSASTMLVVALNAQPRADLEREGRPLLWRERASTIVS